MGCGLSMLRSPRVHPWELEGGTGSGLSKDQSRVLRAILDDIKSRSNGKARRLVHGLGAPQTPSAKVANGARSLGPLLDLCVGLPQAVKDAPLRLLRIASVLKWDRLLVYEAVPKADCLQVPYSKTDDKQWARVVTVSWRWNDPKRDKYVEGFSPMSPEQLRELKALLKVAADNGLQHVWIDWSCVPQYGTESMVEVHRSKVFYVRARTMLVLPTFKPLPEGIVRVILANVALILQAQSKKSLSAAVAGELLFAMLEKNQVAGREYFGRVWTLAERMARHGRNEGLCHWLSLESWLGMLVDAMLKSAEDLADHTSSSIYRKMLGRDAAQRLDAVLAPLAAAVATGHRADGLDALVAELCKAAVSVWLQPSLLAEAPTRQWLQTYLGEDAQSGVYQAWNEGDRVWAVYSYFSWKTQDQSSNEGLRGALDVLVNVVLAAPGNNGNTDVYTAGMYRQLGLAAPQQEEPQEVPPSPPPPPPPAPPPPPPPQQQQQQQQPQPQPQPGAHPTPDENLAKVANELGLMVGSAAYERAKALVKLTNAKLTELAREKGCRRTTGRKWEIVAQIVMTEHPSEVRR